MLQFSITHTNPRLFEVIQTNPKRFSITHTNPRLFEVVIAPVNISVNAVHPASDVYWPGTVIPCHVHVTNTGSAGSQTIEWQVIKTSDQSILSSGSQSSGIIDDLTSAQISLTGIISPSGGNILFKIRARIQGDDEWIYSMQMGNWLYYGPPENPIPRDPPPPPIP
jgi:hypothetical protein